MALLTGCATLQESAAWDPYAYAPPVASKPWDSSGYGKTIDQFETKTGTARFPGLDIAPDPEKVYDLSDLIDLAQRANPETRRAWEQARAAAARLGLAAGAYLPTLALISSAGYSRIEDRTLVGPVYTTGPSITPKLMLEWTLLDFGRRKAALDSALQQLLQFNWQFNRKHQEVAYAVQQNYYLFDASRAKVEAALAALKTATSVQQEAQARLAHGLATRTDMLLARQERARAQFELQLAHRAVADTQAALAESLGISPAAPVRVAEISKLPLPQELTQAVEQVMDQALAQRPDLAARLAELRAREAEVRKARAEFLPTVALVGAVGGTAGSFTPSGIDKTFDYAEPIYGTFLTFSWELFDGFARRNALRQAQARLGEAEAELAALELKTLREVWKAYADVKAALLQNEYAQALLEASQDAYAGAFKGYQHGLSSIVELLAAERDLVRARTTLIESRAELLTASAALAFAVGGLPGSIPE